MIRKRIAVFAYTQSNVGDDIFVVLLLERYPDVEFVVYDSSPHLKIFQRYSNFRCENRLIWTFRRLWNKCIDKGYLKRYVKKKTNSDDAVVRIGGSIFIDSGEPFTDVLYDNEKVFYLGSNYGPEKTLEFRKRVEKQLMEATDVCFRDRYSYGVFSHLNNVRYAPDLLFSYNYSVIKPKQRTIALSVIDPAFGNRGLPISRLDYVSMLNDFVNCANGHGYEVRVFSFCSAEQDSIISEQVKGAKHYCYSGCLDRFLGFFFECEYVVGTRFHATILGWSQKRKVLPVIYSNKLENVLRDLSYSGPFWDMRNEKKISGPDIFGMLKKCASLDEIERLKREAELHFRELDDYLR